MEISQHHAVLTEKQNSLNSSHAQVIIWKEVKLNEWQEVTHYEHQGSANAIAWAPWECGLKLLSCSADGEICLHSRKGKLRY